MSEKNIYLKTLFKIGAVAVTVAALAAFIALERADSNAGGTAADRVEAVNLAADGAVKRVETQNRVDALAADGCQARAVQLMSLHARTPVKSLDDIPIELRSDMLLCVDRGILYGYLRGALTDAGLMGLFAKHTSAL